MVAHKEKGKKTSTTYQYRLIQSLQNMVYILIVFKIIHPQWTRRLQTLLVSRRPLTELPMLKLDEFICFLVNIHFFCSLSLRPPHICTLHDIDRFFSCKRNSKLLGGVPVMTRMMMRFVVREVSKCHSSSNENPFQLFFFVLEYGFVSDTFENYRKYLYIRDVNVVHEENIKR